MARHSPRPDLPGTQSSYGLSVATAEEKKPKIAAALALQDTLTKSGTVRKRSNAV